jgi:hypothetical protein
VSSEDRSRYILRYTYSRCISGKVLYLDKVT